MKDNIYLQNSIRISQIEARLIKNSYFSRENLPSGVDSKVFFFIEKLRKIPNKKIHPNLYHWYILMKQFSINTLKSWQKHSSENQQVNNFISQFIEERQKKFKDNSSTENEKQWKDCTYEYDSRDIIIKLPFLPSTPKNQLKNCKINNQNRQNEQSNNGIQQYPFFKERYLKQNKRDVFNMPNFLNFKGNQLSSPFIDFQYVIEMQLKADKNTPINVLKQRFEKQKIQLLSYEGEEGVKMRVVFRIQKDQCQKLKDKISKWEQISNFQFRKQKKSLFKSERKIQASILSPYHTNKQNL